MQKRREGFGRRRDSLFGERVGESSAVIRALQFDSTYADIWFYSNQIVGKRPNTPAKRRATRWGDAAGGHFT